MTAEERAKLMEQLNDPNVLNDVLKEKGINNKKDGFDPRIEVPSIELTDDMDIKDIAKQMNAALKIIGDQVSNQVKHSVDHTKKSMEDQKKAEHEKMVAKFAKSHKLMEDDTFLAVMDAHYQKTGDLESSYEEAKTKLNMSEKKEDDGKPAEKKKAEVKPTVPSLKSQDVDIDEDELETKTPPSLKETATKNYDSIVAKLDEDPFEKD